LRLLTKMSVKIRTLFSRIPAVDKVRVLYQYLEREASSLDRKTSKPIFALQGVEDPIYYGLLSMISIDVRKRVESSGRLVITRSFNYGVGKGLHAFVMRSGLVSWLISSQWSRINRQVVGAIGYRSQSFSYPFADVYDFACAYKLWRSLKNSENISKLVIRDILVGDLVIDSYLRFRPSPYFLIKDRFVLTALWQAYRDIRRAYDFFYECKPSFYISSYATYIQHGIAVRVALKVGVPVYLVSGGLVFGKKLTLDDYFHTPDTSSYYSIFKKLDRQDQKLSMAEVQLKYRLSGGVDDATAYMKSSAYSYSDEKLPNVKGAAVIFLHDFYDSPHVYDDLIFPDFWSWICFTIDVFIQSGISFWVKPHPNQISLSDNAVQLLLQQYPQLKMISSRVTNSQLVEGGMICGVTAYGTVAHELAYMGVPSICCAKHPHHSFGFCRTAKILDEYRYFLQTPNIQPLPVKEMRRQALTFFYMHNIYGGEDNAALRRQFNTWIREVHDVKGTQLLQELVKFRELSAYNKFIDELVEDIRICSVKQ
jgi:hypothetical protein